MRRIRTHDLTRKTIFLLAWEKMINFCILFIFYILQGKVCRFCGLWSSQIPPAEQASNIMLKINFYDKNFTEFWICSFSKISYLSIKTKDRKNLTNAGWKFLWDIKILFWAERPSDWCNFWCKFCTVKMRLPK